jgi:hypothetical protein
MEYNKRLFSFKSMRNMINERSFSKLDKNYTIPITKDVINDDNGILLVKGSRFNHAKNNNLNVLYEDTNIEIQGKIVLQYFQSNILIDNGNDDIIKIKNPILDVNGFGVKSNGSYNIELNSESNIKVSKGNTVFLVGDPSLKIKLEEDLTGRFLYKLKDKIVIEEKDVFKDVPQPKFIEHSKVVLTKDLLMKLRASN